MPNARLRPDQLIGVYQRCRGSPVGDRLPPSKKIERSRREFDSQTGPQPGGLLNQIGQRVSVEDGDESRGSLVQDRHQPAAGREAAWQIGVVSACDSRFLLLPWANVPGWAGQNEFSADAAARVEKALAAKIMNHFDEVGP